MSEVKICAYCGRPIVDDEYVKEHDSGLGSWYVHESCYYNDDDED